jgi:hypothetical protein
VTFNDVSVAMIVLQMRREQPARIWLTRADLGEMLRDVAGVPVRLRFRDVPVSLCEPPMRSRVVSSSGAVEYVKG